MIFKWGSAMKVRGIVFPVKEMNCLSHAAV